MKKEKKKEKEKLPINAKALLKIEEAVEYTSLGINLIRKMTRDPKCPFVIHVGRRTLIKRKEFEEFLSHQVQL